MEIKIFIIVAITALLMIGAQSAFAISAFESGFRHGVADGKIDTRNDSIDRYYIHQPGQGFADHTTAFVDGYIKGWCLTHHGGGIDANDAPEPTIASFDCDEGLNSASPRPMDWPAS
jgi:hypothetical protein